MRSTCLRKRLVDCVPSDGKRYGRPYFVVRMPVLEPVTAEEARKWNARRFRKARTSGPKTLKWFGEVF
jgi:hypothetical protein